MPPAQIACFTRPAPATDAVFRWGPPRSGMKGSSSMDGCRSLALLGKRTFRWVGPVAALLMTSCGGGTGTEQDSGAEKTYLRVEASDADGDALQYQWRVTAGKVENRNARETVWTLPDGPGLHFAYVVVTDGNGGYVEQQYAVASDALETDVPARAPVAHTAPAVSDFTGATGRLRFVAADATAFAPPGGGAALPRNVYLPDTTVQLIREATGETVFSGRTDLSGEVDLPKLRAGEAYRVRCASTPDAALVDCGAPFTAGAEARVRRLSPPLDGGRNLRLFGHVGLADGGACGMQNEFFALQSAATVQLMEADGTTAIGAPQRVNRFGDYAVDAAVAVNGSFKLLVRCEDYSQTLDVPADPGGYVAARPIEVSHELANRRPAIVKMVANGPEGSVRGRMIEPLPGDASNELPGAARFLTAKGRDTRLSACMYYRGLGAVKDCDAQGNMIEPITQADWERQHQFAPHDDGNTEVAAKFINRMDLNLVRFMRATQTAPDNIAFIVCNHPGPEGRSQAEVDEVMRIAFDGERRVACVAMEWSSTPGVNGGRPFTKFFTFGPDGGLLASINLDFRGEKYMPGACVACHGGSQYNGRFPEKGNPSPYLGSGFLPFDTGNYSFARTLPESAQHDALHGLNQLVRATEVSDDTPVARLVKGWYAGGTTTLDKDYVPPSWLAADADPARAGAARFYREVVGASCRTCHVSLGANFDWDATVLTPVRASAHVCGGTADLAINASMPNALISRDRVAERVRADPALAALMTQFLGCDAPRPDPVYPAR
jgi:mono/diheme cytochrome c family protein